MQPTATHRVAWSVSLSQSSALQKQLNQLTYHLECGLGWAQGTRGLRSPHVTAQFWQRKRAGLKDDQTCQAVDILKGTQRTGMARCTVQDGVHTGATWRIWYDWTIHVQRQCGLMSNYFDHLLHFWHEHFWLQYFCSSLSHTCYITRTCSVTPRLTQSPKRDPWQIIPAHLSHAQCLTNSVKAVKAFQSTHSNHCKTTHWPHPFLLHADWLLRQGTLH